MEVASGRRSQRRRNLACDVVEGKVPLAESGNTVEQKFGIRMRGMLENVVIAPEFHQPPQVHDGHAMGDMPHYADVMADE